MRVSGAFSAYGLEAAAAGTNIAMETLDYIKKIFGQVEEVRALMKMLMSKIEILILGLFLSLHLMMEE